MSDKNSTVKVIAEEAGCGLSTVFRAASELGIRVRGRTEAQHTKLVAALTKSDEPTPTPEKKTKPEPKNKARAKPSRTPPAGVNLREIGDALVALFGLVEKMSPASRTMFLQLVRIGEV